MDEIVGEPAAKRWKGKARSTGEPMEEGEVRFRDPHAAAFAVQQLNNSVLQGCQIQVALDPQATDGTKVVITNMPGGIMWQDLKDHFGHIGEVHYANIGRTVQEVGSVRGFGTALPGYPCVGEVRFATKDDAEKAMQMFNGTPFKDQTLVIKPDLSSFHGTKLLIFNVPVGTDWPELKHHFDRAGQILFCGIDCAAKGKGKKGGFSDQGYPPFVGGGPACGSAGLPESSFGEVRFEFAAHAEQAIAVLDGSNLAGGVLSIVRDDFSRDGSRIFVKGVPSGTQRTLLKEHFEQVGPVAFCGWKGKGGGKGYGKDGKGFQAFAHDPVQAFPMSAGGYHGPPSMQVNADANVPLVGEVRFVDPAQAEKAVALFHGSLLEGHAITVVKDGGCRDGSRVLVLHLPPSIQRHSLQEYFEQVGTVAFCGWKGKGKGKGQQQSVQFVPAAGQLQGAQVVAAASAPFPQQGCATVVPPPPAPAGVGEVIFSNNIEANTAIQMLEGSNLRGSAIVLQWPNPSAGTLYVQNLPPGCTAEELRGHFAQVGIVPYAVVHAAASAQAPARFPSAPPAALAAAPTFPAASHSAGMAPQAAADALLDTLRVGYSAAAPMGAVTCAVPRSTAPCAVPGMTAACVGPVAAAPCIVPGLATACSAPLACSAPAMSAVPVANACAAPMMVTVPAMVQPCAVQGMVSPCGVSQFVPF